MGMGFAPTWLRQLSPPPLLHITTLTTAYSGRWTKGHGQASKSAHCCRPHPYRYTHKFDRGLSRRCCTPSCTGWASHIQAQSHHVQLPTRSSSTVLITVYRTPMWHHRSTFVPSVDVFWSYRDTVSARTAAFAVAGSTVWNSLLRDPDVTPNTDNFKRLLTGFYCATQICIARNCYGDVAGWVAGCPSHTSIISKRNG